MVSRDENNPQEVLAQGGQDFAVSLHRWVGQNRWGNRMGVVAYPRLGASVALGVDPDVLQRKKRSQSHANDAGNGIDMAVAELLTSAMILPFWGNSRYLASWLWGGTCQSRVIPVAGHFLEVVLLLSSGLVQSRGRLCVKLTAGAFEVTAALVACCN